MALFSIMFELRTSLNLKLQVVHVHHGPGPHKAFRDKARSFVEKQAQRKNLPFQVFTSQKELSSEAELRKFRRDSLLAAAENTQKTSPKNFWIMTAHHLEDLVETRLIRLIRGTGAQGLKAIAVKQGPWLRPLLGTSKKLLHAELKAQNVAFIEDPSNKSAGPLRNWIRHTWLPDLEKKRPGSVQSLGRSLELLVLGDLLPKMEASPVWLGPHTLSRGFFHTLDLQAKQQVLAQCLFRVLGLNYSSGQIKEIQKRLDNPQKEHTFKMKNSLWEVNAEQISVRKVSQN